MKGLEQTSTLRDNLYRQIPPEGAEIPILLQPEEIHNGSPEGEEIVVAVQGLCMGRVGGLYGTTEEHLEGWLRDLK